MANSININGTEYRIEGDDLATEATLKALLAAVERMRSSSGTGTGAGASPAAAAGEQLSDAINDVTNDVNGYSQTISMLGRANESIITAANTSGSLLGGLGGMFGKISGTLVRFMPQLLILEKVVGGLIAVFGAIMGVVEEMTGTIKEMYAAGVRFQGGLVEVSRLAGLAGMDIKEFGNLISKNSAAVARFGNGSINQGAKKMTEFARELTFGTANLAGLGVTVGEAAQYMTDYADNQQRMNGINIMARRAGESDLDVKKRVTKETQDYIEDLDMLARATGKTREEMNKIINDLSKDVDLKSTMAMLQLPAKQKDEVIKFGALLSSLPGGDTMMKGLKDMLQFGTMTGETAKAFATVAPQLQGTFASITTDLKAGKISAAQATDAMMDAMGGQADKIAQTLGRIPESMRTQAQKDLLAMAVAAQERQQAREGDIKALMAEGMTRKQAENKLKKQREEEIAANEKFKDASKRLGSIIPTFLAMIAKSKFFTTTIGMISDVIGKFANFMVNLFDTKGKVGGGLFKVFNLVGSAVGLVGKVIGAIWKSIFQPIINIVWPVVEGLMSIIGNVADVFGAIFDFFGGIIDFLSGDISSADFSKLIGNVFDKIFDSFRGFFKSIEDTAKGMLKATFDAAAGFIKVIGRTLLGIITWPFRLFAEAVKSVFNFAGLEGALDGILDPILNLFNDITDWFSSLDISKFFMDITESVGRFFELLILPFSTIYNFITGGIDGVKETLSRAWDTITSPFDTIMSIFSDDDDVAEGSVNVIKAMTDPLDMITDFFSSGLSSIWDGVSSAFNSVMHPLDTVSEFFGSSAEEVESAVSGAIDAAKAPFIATEQFLEDSLTAVMDTVKGMFDAVMSPFRMIEDMFNNFNISEILDKAWEAIKKKLNPFNWFGGDDKEEKKPASATGKINRTSTPKTAAEADRRDMVEDMNRMEREATRNPATEMTPEQRALYLGERPPAPKVAPNPPAKPEVPKPGKELETTKPTTENTENVNTKMTNTLAGKLDQLIMIASDHKDMDAKGLKTDPRVPAR